MDGPTIPRVPSLRTSVPVRDSRSGFDLFGGTQRSFGEAVRVLKTPVHAPRANAFCERLIGTMRRECLDRMIPVGENHVRRISQERVRHYNRGRPHSSLGPGFPEPLQAKVPTKVHRHRLPKGYRVSAKSVLGGLHHEYRLGREAA